MKRAAAVLMVGFLLGCGHMKTLIVGWEEACRLDPSSPVCLAPRPSPVAPPSPVASPSPSPAPEPSPPPSPAPGPVCAPDPRLAWEPVPGHASLSGDVKAAIIRVMDARPARFERNADGAYLLTSRGVRAQNEIEGAQEAFNWFSAALAADLQSKGFCAGFFSDQLEIARKGESVFEGYHVHNRGGGNVIFEPPKYEDTLAPPPPPPVVVSACPPEAPEFAKARMHVSDPRTFPRGIRVDVTPVGAGEAWCAANGFFDPDLSGQGFCPYGQEGSGEVQRRACEAREGPYVFKLNGAVVPQEENPLQIWLPVDALGTIEVCARNGHCSEVIL